MTIMSRPATKEYRENWPFDKDTTNKERQTMHELCAFVVARSTTEARRLFTSNHVFAKHIDAVAARNEKEDSTYEVYEVIDRVELVDRVFDNNWPFRKKVEEVLGQQCEPSR